jgi:hypothetical protein
MRKKTILFIFLILLNSFYYYKSYSQSPCKNNIIRTNPDGDCNYPNGTGAYNTEKSNKRNCQPTIFNWKTEYFNINSIEDLLDDWEYIESPFYQNDNFLLLELEDLKDIPPGVYMCVIIIEYTRLQAKIIKI